MKKFLFVLCACSLRVGVAVTTDELKAIVDPDGICSKIEFAPTDGGLLPTFTKATWKTVAEEAGCPGYGPYRLDFQTGEPPFTIVSETYKRGRVYNLPKCWYPVPDGKSFGGWYCPKTQRRYDDGMLIFNLLKSDETGTMTAIWEDQRP